jgi:hypothetical protein
MRTWLIVDGGINFAVKHCCAMPIVFILWHDRQLNNIHNILLPFHLINSYLKGPQWYVKGTRTLSVTWGYKDTREGYKDSVSYVKGTRTLSITWGVQGHLLEGYKETVCYVKGTRTLSVAGRWPATSSVHYTRRCNTQSSAPEDGRNYRPKHVELIGLLINRYCYI